MQNNKSKYDDNDPDKLITSYGNKSEGKGKGKVLDKILR